MFFDEPQLVFTTIQRNQQNDLRAEVRTLLDTLGQLGQAELWDQAWVKKVFAASVIVQSHMLASTGSLGECRREEPFAPVRPIIDEHGNLKWCCEHTPEHCA